MSNDVDRCVGGRERHFDVNGLHLAALEWGCEGGVPVLALHGWLDNAASFTHLAPALSGAHLIALDMAGHGRSDHRPGVGAYSLWDDMQDVLAVAEVLGWKRFRLLGHSRGAIICAYFASCFPERVEQLALIDGISGDPVAVADAPIQMADALRSLLALQRKSHRIYPDVETAMRARMQGLYPLTEFAARPLTLRGINPVAGGVQWASDIRLLAATPLKFTQEHVIAFLSRIRAPTLLILARDGIVKHYPRVGEFVAQFARINLCWMDGGHHLHLEAQCAAVAARVQDFFQENNHDNANKTDSTIQIDRANKNDSANKNESANET